MKNLKDTKAMSPVKKETTGTSSRAHVLRILAFVISHGFIISPVGYGYFVSSFVKFHCCPCAPDRLSCPCTEAVQEITELGKCKCQLFWRDYTTYMVEKYGEE